MGLFFGYILKWWFFAVLIGLISFPISFVLFRKSQERGYMFSKIIGIFLISYFSWLIGYISFSMVTILAVILGMIGASVFLFLKNKQEIMEFLNEKPGIILVSELFFLFVFIAYGLFRMYQPDIIGTEKFMDFAFMNSIARADKMPPYDPWMHGVDAVDGKPLNISYYYFGYIMMAIMMKLTAIPNGSAFNLALVYIVALSALGITALLYNLTRNFLIGFLAAAFLLVISNLDGFIQVLQNGWSFNGFNWWHTSRIIDYKEYDVTINEFPFFSFLLGDMHPHQMAIPFVLLALNIALSFMKSEEDTLVEKKPEKLAFLIFSGLLLGGLWFLNSWDLPTYFTITALAILSYKYMRDEDPGAWVKDAAIAIGIILLVAVIAYLPFTLSFQSQAKGIGWVKANTKITDYLVIFGIMLFPILSFLIFRLLNWLYAFRQQGVAGVRAKKRELYCPRCGSAVREGKMICGQCGYMISGEELYLGGDEIPVKKANRLAMSFFKFLLEPTGNKDNRLYVAAGVVIAAAVGLVIFKTMIDPPNVGLFAGLMFILLSFVFLLGMTRIEMKENQFVILLLFAGVGVTLACDVVHIIDTFSRPGGHVPLERMNTVFKFYYQAWILFSIAAAYSVFWVRHFYLRFKPSWMRIVWNTLLAVLIVMGLFYPVASTAVKTGGMRGGLNLDGTDFLNQLAYEGRVPARGDLKAINWLKQNIKGNPVIVEAWGGEYTEYARVSSFTGLPTVIGWPGHELQWRGSGDEAGRRQWDVNKIYETLDNNEAIALLDKYKAEYVYVGPLERDKYISTLARDKDTSKEAMQKYMEKKQALDKFAQFMDIIYADQADVVIYKKRK